MAKAGRARCVPGLAPGADSAASARYNRRERRSGAAVASRMRGGLWMALMLTFIGGAAPAQTAPPPVHNPVHEFLLKMKPPERAAWLARTAGKWCIGTDPFFMGLSAAGESAGNAYWSFRCLGRGDFVVQIDPLGGGVAIDCTSFKEAGAGKECFKKF